MFGVDDDTVFENPLHAMGEKQIELLERIAAALDKQTALLEDLAKDGRMSLNALEQIKHKK